MKIERASGKAVVGFGYARDLSARGMAVDAEAMVESLPPVVIGDQMELRFKLPRNDLVLSVWGRVIRLDEGGRVRRIALEFVSLPPDYERAIASFVAATLS